MPNINPVSGAAVYVDPSALRCAYCRRPLSFAEENPQAVGFTAPTQVWCENGECRAYNVVGDVPISTLPGSKHRTKRT